MDAHELRARTAWGLIADPADTLSWRLQHELGPIEALGQVLGSHNIRALSKRLSATLTDGQVSLESLRTYRSRYSPDRVRQALDVQLEQGMTAISPQHPWWPPRLSDLGERAPTTLWVKGSLHQASGTQGVAIVGSSRPTRSGRQAAIACSEGALKKGLTILSGGTRGISTDAHRRRSTVEESMLRWSQEGWRVLTHLTTGPSLVVSCSVGRWSQKFPQPWHQQLESYWLAIEW